MINFRYHLVSIVAIMVALAVGILLGSGPLDEASDSLGDDASSSGRVDDPAVRSFESGFAGSTAEGLLEDELDGQTVVVLTAPGASAVEVKGVTSNLELAGADVTGQVALTSKLLDSSGRQFAEGVAQQAAADVAGVTRAGDTYGRIGAALARALMADKAESLDQTATTIRSAYTEGDLLTLTDEPKRLATLAVVVTGPGRADGADQSTVLAALAGALSTSGKGVVVTGPSSSSSPGGAVQAVRDSEASADISTVDVTDSPAGRIVAALAAAAQAGGEPGAWGTSRSASGSMPSR